jgi:hypothetical protein
MRIGLTENAFDGFFQKGFGVITRHNDGNKGIFWRVVHFFKY